MSKSTSRRNEMIPPPPGPEDGHDAIIAYFDRYPTEELIRAGHLSDPTEKELEELEASGAYMLLRSRGVNLTLSDKDCERLSVMAVRQKVAPEELVQRWVKYLLHKGKRPRKERVRS